MLMYESHAKAMLRAHMEELDALWNENSCRKYEKFCYRNHMEFSYGMTRMVLIGKDFVVKIDKQMCGAWKRFGACCDEYYNYRRVREDGFAYLFAKVTKMKVGHHYYYVMPRVEMGEEDEKDLWRELSEEEYDYVGEHFMDLHEGNYGYDVDDGHVVIIDYAASDDTMARYESEG